MSGDDFPEMDLPPYRFFRGPFENSRKPTIVRDDPEGGDPYILAELGKVFEPEEIQALVDSRNARDGLASEAASLRRQVAMLQKALTPFAAIGLVRDSDYGDREPDMIDGPDLCITPDQVRAARDALIHE